MMEGSNGFIQKEKEKNKEFIKYDEFNFNEDFKGYIIPVVYRLSGGGIFKRVLGRSRHWRTAMGFKHQAFYRHFYGLC